jgi:hypothetical protein
MLSYLNLSLLLSIQILNMCGFVMRMCRGTIEGDVIVISVMKMEASQLIGSAHSSPVTGLEFSKKGRYL